jgi:hypothetical protein
MDVDLVRWSDGAKADAIVAVRKREMITFMMID